MVESLARRLEQEKPDWLPRPAAADEPNALTTLKKFSNFLQQESLCVGHNQYVHSRP